MRLIIAISLIVLTIQAPQNCQKFECISKPDQFADPKCAEKKIEETQVSYVVKNCSNKDTPLCPYLSIAGSGESANCKASLADKNYGGYACQTKDTCLSGECTNSVCVGKVETKECTNHSECNVGLVCRTKTGAAANTCEKPLADGEACTGHLECLNTHGCNKKKCTSLFSLEEGADADKHDREFDERISFCKNGEVIDGKCRAVKSEGVTEGCTKDSDCKYFYNKGEDKVPLNVDDSCECTYNTEGSKNCRNAISDSSFNLQIYQKALNNALTAVQCHTEERFNCSYVKSKLNYVRDNLENNRADVLNQNKLIMVDSCVKQVVFPFYNSEKGVCPKFECKAAQADTCANNDNEKLDDKRVVQISKCAEGKTCDYRSAAFFQIGKYSATCAPTKKALSLPGEKCQATADCETVQKTAGQDFAECDTAKLVCKGSADTEPCVNDDACLVGLFCSNSKCTKQVAAGANCSNTFQCPNNQLCVNGKCSDLYSQKTGTDVSSVGSGFENFACESGVSRKGICGEYKYVTDLKPENGWIQCSMGESMVYSFDTGAGPINEVDYCRCGYNEKGTGFFKLSKSDESTKPIWAKVNDATKKLWASSSNLHTVHRTRGDADSAKNLICTNFTTDPLFKGAVPCAYEVLGAGQCNITPSSGSSSSTTSAKQINLVYAFLIMILVGLFL